MQKILYATDLSAAHDGAFQQACHFASQWKAQLLILHVDESSAKEDEKSLAQSESGQALHHLEPDDIEINYEHVLRTGDPVQAILEVEKAHDVDLVVLGTHGRKGLERVFAGSVAEKVIRLAECPVLTARELDSEVSEELSAEPRILVPTDFSVFSYAALDFASSIARNIGAGITILHVDDSLASLGHPQSVTDPKEKEQLARLWEQVMKIKPREPNIDHAHKLLHGSPKQQISQYANRKNYDYVVLGTHGRKGLGRAVMGSVAEQIVRNANCAVITVKPSNKRHAVMH